MGQLYSTLFWASEIDEDDNEGSSNNSNVYELEPNSLDMWPTNVKIFFPTDDINEIKESILRTQDPKKKYYYSDGQTNSEEKNSDKTEMTTFTSEYHFNTKNHYAILFAPGEYDNCDFEVGYYVQVAGLGSAATDVKFTGTNSGPYVLALNKDLPVTKGGTIAYPNSGLSLDTFWRVCENFSSSCENGMVWSVSQAAPLRRVHINRDLNLVDGGCYASGGVLANAIVEGETNFGGQQQFYCRNVEFGNEIKGCAWNLVLSGCTGNHIPNQGIDGHNKSTIVKEIPPVRVEKPFITLNEDKRFELHIPMATTDQSLCTGPQLWATHGEIRDFSKVKLGIPRQDIKDPNDIDAYNKIDEIDEKITNDIQNALNQGKDIVLCPGEFFLTRSLIIQHNDQVILGLGLATLIAPKNGSPCIRVKAKTAGVRIAGIMLQASVQYDGEDGKNNHKNSDGVLSLLEWGEPEHIEDDTGDPNNPGVLTDIFARVGGVNLDRNVKTNAMIRIHSSNVVGDNIWLWRADHTRLGIDEKPNDANFPYYHQTLEGECDVENALIVNGNNVIMYGLFCEHTTQHQLIWNGENGHVYFYQCELPYDVSNNNFGLKGYAGYYINDNVKTHNACGVGIYSNFKKEINTVPTAIIHPENKATKSKSVKHEINNNNDEEEGGINITYPFTVFLSNLGVIQSVINGKGPEAILPGKPTRF